MKRDDELMGIVERHSYCISPVLYNILHDAIITWARGSVPDEETEYTPPSFTSPKKVQSDDYVAGFNACRQQTLKNIGGGDESPIS